jgi:hypothetical protein
VANNATLPAWQAVPARVEKLLLAASSVKVAHLAAAKDTPLLDVATVTWAPAENVVRLYRAGATNNAYVEKYAACLPECSVQFVADREFDGDTEILIKQAGIPVLAKSFDFAQKALGGPTPLTNALVGGLMMGGLGYGAGALAENLLPEQYFERGKLRRTLGLGGLLAGAGFGTMNAYSNARANVPHQDFFQAPIYHTMRGFLMRNDAPLKPKWYMQPTPPRMTGLQMSNDFGADVSPSIMDEVNKTAAFNDSSLFAPSVPVHQFNTAVWQDTQKGMTNGFQMHTPPAYAAAATGLMTGLSAGTNSPVISPMTVIHGIASAGVGLATANIAGRALSALAGLTPAGQNKLQDMGLWGGMMHAIVPAMMGLR